MSLTKKTIKYITKECNASLENKTVLITGANSGIGFKTAETMIYLGAKVIMACRNISKANDAKNKLLVDYPNASIDIMKLDLSSFKSIETFVNELHDVDVFVNNAGILHEPGKKTSEGFDLVFGTNYFGLFYLSELILPKLKNIGHEVIYINTISIIHKIAKLDYKKIDLSKGAYARSKLAIARYTNYLVNKYSDTNIHIYMNHPGMSITPIAKNMIGWLYGIAKFAPINSSEKSSLSVAYILSHSIKEGSVVGPSKGFNGWGYPSVNKPCKKANMGIDELYDYSINLLEEHNFLL